MTKDQSYAKKNLKKKVHRLDFSHENVKDKKHAIKYVYRNRYELRSNETIFQI